MNAKKKQSLTDFFETVKEGAGPESNDLDITKNEENDAQAKSKTTQAMEMPEQSGDNMINKNESDQKHDSFQGKSIADILYKGSVPKTYRGFYIDNDLSRALDQLSKKGGKGVISEIANVAIRQYLIEQNVLKK